MASEILRPTKEQLMAAQNGALPDVIAPGLKVLFCGINPGLYTAAIQCHFGRPGNRFWRALHDSGFTPDLKTPQQQSELLPLGLGITNLVARATAAAAELEDEELIAGALTLETKAERYRPLWVAFVGVGAYRVAFRRTGAVLGRQPERIADSGIWLLPNTSGLNANHRPQDFARLFSELKSAIELT